MRKFSATIRRSTAALAVATGMLAITGPANAAGTGLPAEASGRADSQALRIQLTLPGVDQLKASLAAAGVPVGALPNTNLGGITIDQKVSWNHGKVLHNVDGVSNQASGFATAITGVLPVLGDTTRSVASSCTASGCNNPAGVALINTDLPAGLGHIKIAGADSVTKNLLDTRNETGLVKANLDIRSLIGKGMPLAAVGDALRQLTTTVNTEVLGPINTTLENLEKTLATELQNKAPAVKAELDRLITLDTIAELPDLSEKSLANLTVNTSKADVFTKKVNGVTGMSASSSAKVTDVSLLGGWAGVEAVGIDTEAFANGHRGDAVSNAQSQIAGLNLGGLLGLHIDRSDLARLEDPETLNAAIREAVKDNGLPTAAGEDLINAHTLARTISGVDIDFFGTTEEIDPKGESAFAEAGTIALIVEPKIPVLDSMFTDPGETVPQFGEYASTGMSLRIDLPTASSAVSVAANVIDRRFPAPRSRTGVGSPFLVVALLFGAALIVRKFAMTR